jgi:hypothetical protein
MTKVKLRWFVLFSEVNIKPDSEYSCLEESDKNDMVNCVFYYDLENCK